MIIISVVPDNYINHLAAAHHMGLVRLGRSKVVLRPKEKLICDHCNKEFYVKTRLRRHITEYHKPVKCPDCPLYFSPYHLKLHSNKVHGASIPTCGICGVKSTTNSMIVAHQRRVHLKEKNVQCKECDAKFYDMTVLRKHMATHSDVKQFECSFCKKKFKRRNALTAHERIHTGDKRKMCHICQERFVQKASLNYHMTKHHPEAI
jgi:KRAB domain-containing zinc finger protein